jgi:hypothetical protein
MLARVDALAESPRSSSAAKPVELRTAMAERHAWPVSLDLNPDVV